MGACITPICRSLIYSSFSDNFKSRISTQLFGDEAPTGAYKSYSRHRAYHNCDTHPRLRSWCRPPPSVSGRRKSTSLSKEQWVNDLGNYSAWPKVAGAVIEAMRHMRHEIFDRFLFGGFPGPGD